jgi:hypothetical protein
MKKTKEYEMATYSEPLEEVVIDIDFAKLVDSKPKHSGLKRLPWYYLVLIASTGFATVNVIMVNLAQHSMMTQYYNYNLGGVIVCLTYFVIKHFGRHRHALLDSKPPRKILTDPETDKFDVKMFLVIVLSAVN